MTPVSVLVGLPYHCLAAESPAEGAVIVSALSQVSNFFSVNVNESDVAVVPSAFSLVRGQKIMAVRTPFERNVAVCIGIVHAFQK